MQRQPSKGKIVPKISTMPRQKSEAAAFLDIYKLTIEKKRLRNELQGMEQRRQQILNRLVILETQVHELEHQAQQLRAIDGEIDGLISERNIKQASEQHTEQNIEQIMERNYEQNSRYNGEHRSTASSTDSFDTLFLEY